MASIIPGYEYDIFISYRQKDNKHDGWVTEFIDNLKGELESTFKEEVSVYFDINPNDGLLETHDVDASLKEKLKCLIFIPIISQTYCDSKSFAWQNEFVAFNKLAKEDQFGRDIRFAGGNVASRILPVKIHDLDPEDKTLLENELGGVLRCVEFIYKSAGVNRPLRANEDHPQDNLNKTYYRDQINKVANAVKEIIVAIKKHNQQDGDVPKEVVNAKPESIKKLKPKIIITSVMALALIVLGFFFIPKLFESSKPVAKSIAVLPFHNYSSEPDQENISDGLTSEIINHLYKIKSFDKVVSLSTVLTYKGTDKKIPQMANELNVNYILEGTYRKIDDQVRVTAQLIDPKNDNNLWQNEYDKPYKELIGIQADIALQIAGQVKAYITSSEKQNIQKIPTSNQTAYELIQKGLYLWNTRSFKAIDQMLDLTLKAIKLDPDYSDAYAFAGLCTLLKGSVWGGNEMNSVVWDASSYLDKALELDQNNCTAHLGLAWFNDWIRWDYIRAEKEFLKIFDLEPNNPLYPELYIEILLKRNQLDEALNYKVTSEQSYRLIQINILSGSNKEINSSIKSYLESQGVKGQKYAGDCYLWAEEYDSARLHLEAAVKSEDSVIMLTPRFQAYQALAYYKTNQHNQAQKIIKQLTFKSSITTAGSPDYFAGWYYSGIGEIDSAFYWLEKAFKNRSIQLAWLKADPVFKTLKADNRYWDLYARTGHKAYDDYIAGMKKQ
ncbi:MAG: hypothetical protein NTV31_15720 [Bacteroidia bacterium]|nr:hypothetical protein [Bacteroidia bacterium]